MIVLLVFVFIRSCDSLILFLSVDILPRLKTRDSIISDALHHEGITSAEETLPFGYSLSLFTEGDWVSGTASSAGPFHFILKGGCLHPFHSDGSESEASWIACVGSFYLLNTYIHVFHKSVKFFDTSFPVRTASLIIAVL